MDVEIFTAHTPEQLRNGIRQWLRERPVLVGMVTSMQYQAVVTPTNQIEYSVVILYVPLNPL